MNKGLKIGIIGGGLTLAGLAVHSICKATKLMEEEAVAKETLHNILNDMSLKFTGAVLNDDYVTASRVCELYDEIVEKYEDELYSLGILDEIEFRLSDEQTEDEIKNIILTILNSLRSAHMTSVSAFNSTKFEAITEGQAEVHRRDANVYADAYNKILQLCKNHLAEMKYPHTDKLEKLNIIEGNDIEKLHKSIRININGGYMANVVRDSDLSEHIQYNLANYHGSALLINDEIKQYGHFREDQKDFLIDKSKSIPVILSTATIPYR